MKIVGLNIKKLREQQGLTLRELASKLDVTASFISQVEQGKAAPSLAKLKMMADALSVTVGELVGEEETPEKRIFLRKNERRSIKKIGKGINIEILTEPDFDKQMEALFFTLKRGATSGGKKFQHFGQEFALVQKGSLEVSLNGKKYLLKEGDSLYFQSSIPHSFRNKSNGRTEVLWVITPPSF